MGWMLGTLFQQSQDWANANQYNIVFDEFNDRVYKVINRRKDPFMKAARFAQRPCYILSLAVNFTLLPTKSNEELA